MNTDGAVAPDKPCATSAEGNDLLYPELNGSARLHDDPLETSVFIGVHPWFQYS